MILGIIAVLKYKNTIIKKNWVFLSRFKLISESWTQATKKIAQMRVETKTTKVNTDFPKFNSKLDYSSLFYVIGDNYQNGQKIIFF